MPHRIHRQQFEGFSTMIEAKKMKMLVVIELNALNKFLYRFFVM